MSRPIEINRVEAELLVDLLEDHSDGSEVALQLADEIRQMFGMSALHESYTTVEMRAALAEASTPISPEDGQ